MIKASSMQTEPKGRIPPMNMVTMLLMCHGTSGMMRAIWFVFVGTSMEGAFNPTNAPAKTKGAEIHTHNRKRTIIVRKLTAVAAPAKLKKKFVSEVEGGLVGCKNTPDLYAQVSTLL